MGKGQKVIWPQIKSPFLREGTVNAKSFLRCDFGLGKMSCLG